MRRVTQPNANVTTISAVIQTPRNSTDAATACDELIPGCDFNNSINAASRTPKPPGAKTAMNPTNDADQISPVHVSQSDSEAATPTARSVQPKLNPCTSQIVTNNLVYASPTAGTASLVCTGVFGSTSALSQARITAIRMGAVTNTP